MAAPHRAGSPRPEPGADGTVGLEVRAGDEGATTTLTVGGELDTGTGRALLAAVRRAVTGGAHRLELDLRGIDSFTAEGAAALGTCRQLAAGLAGGLHFLTSQGAAMEALIEGCATENVGG